MSKTVFLRIRNLEQFSNRALKKILFRALSKSHSASDPPACLPEELPIISLRYLKDSCLYEGLYWRYRGLNMRSLGYLALKGYPTYSRLYAYVPT